MITIDPIWVSKNGISGERESGAESQDLFAQIVFRGEHYLPTEDIARRVMGMKEGEYVVIYEPDSLAKMVFSVDQTLLMSGEERLIEGQRATIILRPLYWPSLGNDDFLDMEEFGNNLLRYQQEVSGRNLSIQDIPGLDVLRQQMEIFKTHKAMAQERQASEY